MIGQLRSVGYLANPLAKVLEVGRQLRIFINAILLDDLPIRFAAKIDLICLTQEHELLFAANRIGSTGKHPENKNDQTRSDNDYPDFSL